MNNVAQSEYKLLTVAESLFSFSDGAKDLILNKNTPITTFGPTTARILQGIVSKGIVISLGTWGGWENKKRVQNNSIGINRFWDQKPIKIQCSKNTIKILLWLVQEEFKNNKVTELTLTGMTLGDSIVLSRALDLLQNYGIKTIPKIFTENIFCWLMHMDTLYQHGDPNNLKKGLDNLCENGILLSAVQQELAKRWTELEMKKEGIKNIDKMIALGSSQNFILSNIVSYARKAARPDLCWFIFKVLENWIKRTDNRNIAFVSDNDTVEKRQTGLTYACALLSTADLLYLWVEDARTVRFFDDNYEINQLLIQYWTEMIQDRGLVSIKNIVEKITNSFEVVTNVR